MIIMNKKSVSIILDNMNKIKSFCEMTMKYPDRELFITSGNYKVNAMSLMGILSLDLFKPVTLEYNSDFEDEVIKLFGEFIVKV